MTDNNYIPGVCNIGQDEIKKRIQTGITGLIITVLAFTLFVYFDVSRWIRFLVFIPAALSAVGFLQAKMKFCAYFGLAGIFNFDKLGRLNKIENKEFLEKDKKKARQIILYSILIGVAVGILAAST